MHGPAPAVALLTALLLTCAPAAPAPRALMAPDPPDRGRTLALHVSLCVFCHSEIDWKAEGYPPLPGAAAAGRLPSAPNLTPDPDTGTGRWTDERFERGIRRAAGHHGAFHHLSDDDVASITAYLRSLPAVKRAIPPPEVPSPVHPREPVAPPSTRGEYLAAIALCASCHTPVDDRGRAIPGMELAGGLRLKGPWGDLHTPNLTPDASGLSHIGAKGFVHAMKTGELPGRTLNAVMPWGYYRRMPEDDLRAIHGHLMTVKPVRHFIDNRAAPTPCRKCGRPHGLGNRN